MKSVTLILMLTVLFNSCIQTDKKSDVPVFQVNPELAKPGKFSDYFDNLTYLKLEFDPQNPIGNITNLEVREDAYYIFDSRSNKVFKYGLGGELIMIIDKQGKGPGEYQRISSISINETDHEVIISDKMGMAIRYYSSDDGTFIRKMDMDYIPLALTYIGKGKIAAHLNFVPHQQEIESTNPHNLIYFRSPDKPVSKFLPFDPTLRHPFYGGKMFTNTEKGTFFMPPFYHQVFLLNESACEPFLELDFGKYNFRYDIFGEASTSSEQLDRMYKSHLVYTKTGFAEMNDYYFFQYGWKGIIYFAFLNKSTQEVHVHKKFTNDINGFSVGFLKESGNNKLLFAIDSHDLVSRRNHFHNISKDSSKSQAERESAQRYCDRMDSIIGPLTENDNPVIGIYEMKTR